MLLLAGQGSGVTPCPKFLCPCPHSHPHKPHLQHPVSFSPTESSFFYKETPLKTHTNASIHHSEPHSKSQHCPYTGSLWNQFRCSSKTAFAEVVWHPPLLRQSLLPNNFASQGICLSGKVRALHPTLPPTSSPSPQQLHPQHLPARL